MRKIIAFNGSPRANGNTSFLLNQFIKGTANNTNDIYEINAYEANIKPCGGCLRCNMIKKCSISGDGWEDLSQKLLKSNVIVFASPVYFHHLTAPLKAILDRFRSFLKIKITETGLIHKPFQEWEKDFVLILSMGSSDDIDAKPIIDLFNFFTETLGAKNKLHVIKGTRLAITNQVIKNVHELKELYKKLGLPQKLVEQDYIKNKELLNECYNLGSKLSATE